MEEENKTSCSCGIHNKDNNLLSCLPHSKSRGRKCPCITSGVYCGSKCRCRGCENEAINKATDKNHLPLSCRCGERGLPADGISCRNAENRKSRCPCFKNKQPCTENCFCKSCNNLFGENSKIRASSSSPAAKRKRSNPSPFKRTRSVEFLLQRNCEITSTVWSTYETCLLFGTITVLISSCVPLSVNNVNKLYNHVVKSRICETRKLPVRPKNVLQIQGKLKHLVEKQQIMKIKAKAGNQE